jgi:calcium/calmodulin-dependent protein kinase I
MLEETWKQQRQIGSGGYASVWLEKCINGRKRGKVRAVKKIALSQNRIAEQTYVRELEAVTKFSHQKVWRIVLEHLSLFLTITRSQYERCFVRSFGWYHCEESLCITMEFFELGDLQRYLSSAPPLPEIEAQEITFQMLEGLRYMHQNGFAHRDLKPSVSSPKYVLLVSNNVSNERLERSYCIQAAKLLVD